MAFEGHIGIFGQTFTGKSYLGKKLYAERYLKAGINVLVLDANYDEWPCTWKTDDFEEFYRAARLNPSSFCIIDEGAETLDWYDERANWFANRSRHFGNRCLFVTQRPAGFSTNIRGQISVVHCFFLNQKRDAQACEEISGIPWRLPLALPFYQFYTWKAREGRKPPVLQSLKVDGETA